MRVWAVFSAVGLVAIAAGCAGEGESTVAVRPAAIDFGIVRAGEGADKTVFVRNNSAESVRLRLQWECGCIRAEPAELTLNPGAERAVAVRAAPPSDSGGISSNLYLIDGATGGLLARLPVRAAVVPGVYASEQVLQVTVSESEGEAPATMHLRGLSPEGFAGRAVFEGEAADYVKGPEERVVAAQGDNYALVVRAVYPGPRRVRGRLHLVSEANDRKVLSIPVVLTGMPTLRAIPRFALLDGRSGETCIEVERTDGRPFAVTRIRAESALSVVTARPEAFSEAARHRLLVGLRPGAVCESHAGRLVVTTMAAGMGESELEIPVLVSGRT